MFAFLSIATLVLSTAAHPLRHDFAARHHALAALAARKEAPAGWLYDYLEDYQTYHERYLALNCQNQHNTAFFDACCHPMLATETLEKNRAPECKPDPSALSSAVAAEPTSTVKADYDDDNNDEEDCQDDDQAVATTTSTEAPKETESKTTQAAQEENTPQIAAAAKDDKTSEKQPDPTTTTTTAEQPKETKSEGDNNNNNSDNSNSGGQVFQGGQVTFYDQNGQPGACGEYHSDWDLIAAMNAPQYDSLDVCGKKVQITAENGKSVTVTVVDKCPGCETNSIDLSRGAFQQLGDFSLGIIKMSWKFV